MTFDGTWKVDRNDNYEKFMEQMGEWCHYTENMLKIVQHARCHKYENVAGQENHSDCYYHVYSVWQENKGWG